MSDIVETLEKMAMPDQDGRRHPCCDDFSRAAREIRELRGRIEKIEDASSKIAKLRDVLSKAILELDTLLPHVPESTKQIASPIIEGIRKSAYEIDSEQEQNDE